MKTQVACFPALPYEIRRSRRKYWLLVAVCVFMLGGWVCHFACPSATSVAPPVAIGWFIVVTPIFLYSVWMVTVKKSAIMLRPTTVTFAHVTLPFVASTLLRKDLISVSLDWQGMSRAELVFTVSDDCFHRHKCERTWRQIDPYQLRYGIENLEHPPDVCHAIIEAYLLDREQGTKPQAERPSQHREGP